MLLLMARFHSFYDCMVFYCMCWWTYTHTQFICWWTLRFFPCGVESFWTCSSPCFLSTSFIIEILFYVFRSIIVYWTHICKTQCQQFTHEPSCFSYTLTISSSLDYFERFEVSPWQLPLWVVMYLSDHPFHLDVMTSLGLNLSLDFLGLPQCLAHSTLS